MTSCHVHNLARLSDSPGKKHLQSMQRKQGTWRVRISRNIQQNIIRIAASSLSTSNRRVGSMRAPGSQLVM